MKSVNEAAILDMPTEAKSNTIPSRPSSQKLVKANAMLESMTTPTEAHLQKAITVAELHEVLIQLGFEEKSDGKALYFTHFQSKMKIKRTKQPLDKWLSASQTAQYAKRLTQRGILESEDKLLIFVKANRFKSQIDEAFQKALMMS